MRLIDAYIENFGGLSAYSISFDKELTVIMESNGFGKSTLAAFIKAMFYGFPKGARSLDKNERKLYTPWQGGKFGGNLSFEYEGVSYRIERSFGATPKQDDFALYELEPFKKSERFSENIGQELFKLDVESYEKSTYMAQNGTIGTFATAGIQTKLGDLVEEADDIYNFDKAVEALREKRISLKSFRGQTGKIYEIKNEISHLQAKLAEKSSVEAEIDSNKCKYDELNLQGKENEIALKNVRERITKASEMAVLENLSKRHEELIEEIRDISCENDSLRAAYNYDLPKAEEIEIVYNARDNIKRTDAVLAALYVSKEDIQTVEKNKDIFKDGIPSVAEIDALHEKISRLKKGEKELLELEAKKQAEIDTKIKKQKVIPFTLMGGFLIGAIVLFALKFLLPAIVLTVLSVISLIVAILLSTKKSVLPDEELKKLSDGLGILDGQILAFLKSYYPNKLITPEEYSKYTFELSENSRLYENAIKNVLSYEKEKGIYEQERETQKQIVENFANAHGFSKNILTDDRLKKLSADIHKTKQLSEDLNKAKERLTAFEKENNEKLKRFVKGSLEDIEALKEKEAELLSFEREIKTALITMEQRQAQLIKVLEQFPIFEDELEENTLEFNEKLKACEILDQTIEYLSNAKDTLNYNYVKPVKDRFDYYVNQVLNKDNLNIFMDKELNVKPEQYGEAKDLAYFSAGYTDIVRVCMHFALVDVLFEETDGFIILDDPFVNLDDEKTKETLDLLKELSKRRQILYMTCNSSRI